APVTASVWHTSRVSGGLVAPESALTVMLPPEPTLAVATAKAPVPAGPGTSTVPVSPIVAATAITSGTGVTDDDSRSVVRPGVTTAASTFVHVNAMKTSVGANIADGVRANTKLWLASGGMSTGVFGNPVTALV